MTLIEKLEQLSNKYFNQCAYHGDNADLNYGFAIDKAINIVKQHQSESEWISVDERLPDKEQEVIAVLELTGFYVLAFFRNGIWYNADDGEQIARHKDRQAVTYWMPTPQPPK